MTERYRKLPGRRRGILHGASVWIGGGHLLSVRSTRFREEYKRFYLRDVHAIGIARMPRFHISTRSIAIGAAWAVLRPFYSWAPLADAIFWTGWALLAAAWVYVSTACSCKCRIFTAVSRDELPSVYRTWTARRFLGAVGPRIAEVQGVIEGNWTEIVEQKAAAPSRHPVLAPQPSDAAQPAPAIVPELLPRRTSGRAGSLAAYVFVACLFAEAIVNGMTLQTDSRAVFWTVYGLTLVQVASGILILLQFHRGLLRRAMQRLAIVSLVATGILYYLGQVVAGVREDQRGAMATFVVASRGPLPLIWVGIAADSVLGLAGLVVLTRGEAEP